MRESSLEKFISFRLLNRILYIVAFVHVYKAELLEVYGIIVVVI